MYSLTALYLYKVVFSLELVVAETLVCSDLRRKRRFLLRLALSAVIMAGAAFAIPLSDWAYNAFYCSGIFLALFEDAMASSGVSGAYLTFGNGTLTVSHMQHVYNETAATAVTENVTDGEEFTLGITAVRENDSSVSFSLTINGVPVTFTQSGDPTVTTVETDKITLNSEADMMFGQRLCIVPDPDSTVSVSGLTLPEEQTA